MAPRVMLCWCDGAEHEAGHIQTAPSSRRRQSVFYCNPGVGNESSRVEERRGEKRGCKCGFFFWFPVTPLPCAHVA